MNDSLKEIIAGSVAGGLAKLVEYPFDTVKVRLQTQPLYGIQYVGSLDCLGQAVRTEGIFGMYKGVSAPIVAAAAENSVLFCTFGYFEKLLGDRIDNLAMRASVCGGLSGLVASIILTPIELVKCRVQVDAKSQTANIGKIVVDVLKTKGVLGFWRGQTATAFREAGGSAAWFGSYYFFKEYLNPLLAGAIAGISYNITLYPADSIKSVMQTEESMRKGGQRIATRSFWQTGLRIVETNGIRGLYRGSLITCLRAGPSNAIIFSVHEYVKTLLL